MLQRRWLMSAENKAIHTTNNYPKYPSHVFGNSVSFIAVCKTIFAVNSCWIRPKTLLDWGESQTPHLSTPLALKIFQPTSYEIHSTEGLSIFLAPEACFFPDLTEVLSDRDVNLLSRRKITPNKWSCNTPHKASTANHLKWTETVVAWRHKPLCDAVVVFFLSFLCMEIYFFQFNFDALFLFSFELINTRTF